MSDQPIGENPIRLFAVQARDKKDGFYIAFVPQDFDQFTAALSELGIEAEQSLEIGGWKTTSQNVAIAFVPFPPPQVAELLEPSKS
jgi:hypothetical protein